MVIKSPILVNTDCVIPFFNEAVNDGLSLVIITKILVSDQDNQIRNLESKILKVNEEIDKLKVDLSYITRPQKLSEINDKEFNLVPILQKDIIEYKENEKK